jgi:hypothetical protein
MRIPAQQQMTDLVGHHAPQNDGTSGKLIRFEFQDAVKEDSRDGTGFLAHEGMTEAGLSNGGTTRHFLIGEPQLQIARRHGKGARRRRAVYPCQIHPGRGEYFPCRRFGSGKHVG